MLESAWQEATNDHRYQTASTHDVMRAIGIGSLAFNMNRNKQKRRKDRKKHELGKVAARHLREDLETASDVQLPLPTLDDDRPANATPCPLWKSRSSRYTTQSRNSLPPPQEPTEESAEQERSPELEGSLEPEVPPEPELSPEMEVLPEPELSPEPEARPELPTSNNSTENTLAKLAILVESKMPDGMKLCYQFRDLVPHTRKGLPLCTDLTKWDVFAKKLQQEMKFDIHNDQVRIACEGLCRGACIIHDSSLRALLQCKCT